MFYIPYKICKHGLISIVFIASVYELFDNPSYSVEKNVCVQKTYDIEKDDFIQAIIHCRPFEIQLRHSSHVVFMLVTECYLIGCPEISGRF